MWDGWGNANYHSLQVSSTRTCRAGLFMKGAYTWSKAINMADDDGWAGLPLTNIPGPAPQPRAGGLRPPHMFVMSWVYEMPWGRGKPIPLSGFADYGAWRLARERHLLGLQRHAVHGVGRRASLNAPGSSQTADQIGESSQDRRRGPGHAVLRVESFRDPNFQRPAGTFRFGTMGRNAMRGPGFQKADLAMFKDFRLTERFTSSSRRSRSTSPTRRASTTRRPTSAT
jgi:hypothetical protein